MNHPSLAIQPPAIALSNAEIERLNAICQRTLAAQPHLSAWISEIEISAGVKLPFLPIRCFRLMDVSRFSKDERSQTRMTTFRSSGSTQSTRAAHHLGPEGWQAYRQAAIGGFADAAVRLGIPPDTPIVSLVPTPQEWPESSLAAMINFWKESGLDVRYCAIEQDPSALKKLFTENPDPKLIGSCVVFGTSLHLLSVAQWHARQNGRTPFIPAKKIWFFDTGGTKGKTINTNSAELQSLMQNWVESDAQVGFYSEYGMSELSSQAYTLAAPHSGTFKCAPTLRSIVIAPDLSRVSPIHHLGFLAFIDLANEDSWPLIITEDLGLTADCQGRVFQLVGRAPDATIKGCSLNVKSNFRFDLDHGKHTALPQPISASAVSKTRSQRRTLFDGQQLIDKLRGTIWTEPHLDDLRSSLINWRQPSYELAHIERSALADEVIAITASANIPITWLFPAAHAWLMGAQRIDLHLPSVRQEDPVSEMVRAQIVALADAFNHATSREFIRTVDNRLSLHSTAHRALVFGHDETIQTIRFALSTRNRHLPVIGLGHFQNKISLRADDAAERIAETTVRWLGRGCLTPLVGVIPPQWSDSECKKFMGDWVKTSARLLNGKLPKGWTEHHQHTWRTAHRHNLAELKALARIHKVQFEIEESNLAGAVGVILQSDKLSALEESGLAEKLLDWGGCGWLTLARATHSPDAWNSIAEHDPNPGLWDTHQGLRWDQWLLNEKHSSKEG